MRESNALAPRARAIARILVVTIGALVACRPAALAQCVGDCKGTGQVTISDLILGVNIVLGSATLSACEAFENGDGQVNVAQLVKGVNNALNGCPPEPTATVTATGTATIAATAKPTAPALDTPSARSTASATITATTPPTLTPVATPTITVKPTSTAHESPTASATASAIESPTPIATANATATVKPTATMFDTPTVTPTPANVTLRIGSAMGAPGQTITFSVVVSTAGRAVIGTDNDILIAADAPIGTNALGVPDCQSSTGMETARFLPIGCMGDACTAVEVVYFKEPVPDGTVAYKCNVTISASAATGPIDLVCQHPAYLDPMAQQFDALCTNGTILVQ